MSRAITTPPQATGSRSAPSAVLIRFAPDAAAPTRRYVDPRPAVATADPADPADPAAVAAPPAWPELTGELRLLLSPDRRPLPSAATWLAGPDHPDAPQPIVVPLTGGRLTWRPARAVLAGPVQNRDDVVAALVDFAFYEGELRQLEQDLPPLERAAAGDIPRAYRIADGDAAEWSRLGETMERLAALRLTFARLEPRLDAPPRSLPVAGRRTFRKLVARAGVEDRLAAVSDRLEACEDLYEGAVDRVTDHRWWRKGHRLEAIIVVLLAIEGLQLAAELALRVWQSLRR